MAELSRKLGEINTQVPLEDTLEDIKLEEWDNDKVLELFEELRFNRYIEKFNLRTTKSETINSKESDIEIIETKDMPNFSDNKLYYYLEIKDNQDPEKIIKKEITGISIYTGNKIYYIKKHDEFISKLKNVFENETIEKYGYNLSEDYILLKQIGITMKNIVYDVKVAAYILNPTSKYTMDVIAKDYLEIENSEYLQLKGVKEESKQTSLFDGDIQDFQKENSKKIENCLYAEEVYKLTQVTFKKLEEINAIELFKNIDMPTVEVLAEMQWNGMYVDIDELEAYGK